jgi:hypothetical protein
MRKWSAFVVVVAMSYAGAPLTYAAAQTVHIVGCVSPGVESGCLMIKDKVTGTTYQINSANPKPDPAQHLAVVLKGQVVEGFDFCMQGPILKEITWNYTKMLCQPGQ